MGALMPEYIRVINKNGYTEKIVTPIDFNCSLSINYDKNALSFALPLNEGVLEIGTLVMYPGFDGAFGGRIKIYDIDEEKQIVKYTGDSWTGLFNNYVCALLPYDDYINLKSDASYPGEQNSLSASTYPHNGIYPYLYHAFDVLGLPFEATPCEIYPTNETLTINVKVGGTIADAMKAISSVTNFVPVIQYTDDAHLLSVNFIAPTHHGAITEDKYDIVPPYVANMVYTKEDSANVMFNKWENYTFVTYIADDATYKHQRVYYPGQEYEIPTDLKYEGVDMVASWYSGSEYTSAELSNILKSEREQASISKISTEITYPYGRGYGLDFANIGDFVTLRMRKAKKEQEQKILKKTLKLTNGTPYVTVSFG